MSLNDLVAEAKKEGHLNTIALPLQAAAGQLIADLPPARAAALPVGARVVSDRWGDGTVQRYDGDQVTVLFDGHGYRDLLVSLVLERGLLRAAR